MHFELWKNKGLWNPGEPHNAHTLKNFFFITMAFLRWPLFQIAWRGIGRVETQRNEQEYQLTHTDIQQGKHFIFFWEDHALGTKMWFHNNRRGVEESECPEQLFGHHLT